MRWNCSICEFNQFLKLNFWKTIEKIEYKNKRWKFLGKKSKDFSLRCLGNNFLLQKENINQWDYVKV